MILDNNIKAENKFKHILEKFREEIINDWIHRLHTQVSERYSKLPIKVSEHNMPEAIDAYYEMIIYNNFSKIDRFIQRIAQERLEEGFPLSDVQKAFELYRTILTPIIVGVSKSDAFDTLFEVFSCVDDQPWRLITYQIILLIMSFIGIIVLGFFTMKAVSL